MTVWNASQKREAVELHGVPAHAVVCTGAQGWDAWFAREPSRGRQEFCREAGLDPERPFLMYAESSGYTTGEGPFVARWVEQLRERGGTDLAGLGVLVRPHPQTLSEQWADAGVTELDGVAVWPPHGEMPLNERGRANFYDSIFHAAGVVGINTTSFIDSAIVGRPCLAYAPAEYRTSQEETQHFRYLLEENGGHLLVAETIENHIAQIRDVLNGRVEAGERARGFIESFVRPAGADVEASPRFVSVVEDAGWSPRPPALRHPPGASLITLAMTPVALRLSSGADRTRHGRVLRRFRAMLRPGTA
jgi:hypothetical protein